MGHPDIKTPHLDKLASRSLVFERGYVASPLCRPSLASIATGLYPFQHGITGNDVGSGGKDRAALDAPMKAAFHKHPSFIKMLTDNGYLAHQSGKWWEGSYKDGGFTHGMTHGDPEHRGRHGDAGLKIGRFPKGKSMKPVTDFIDLATKEKKPFLLWYAPFLPHTPHNPPQRLLEKYTQPGRAEDVAKYYAMCERFDETCGELLGYLDKKNLTENTMVIYISDNGWAARSTNASDPNQKSWKDFALRSKGSPYENGIRSPIMVSWPGHVRTGNTQRAPAHAIDIFPTIAAAAGLKAPENLQGINLLNAEARRQRRPLFGVTNSIMDMTPGDPDSTLQYLWCIEDSWKLLVRYDGKDTTRYKNVHAWDTAPVRLYKLKTDPHEKNDVAEANPHIVKKLSKKIDAWHRVDERSANPVKLEGAKGISKGNERFASPVKFKGAKGISKGKHLVFIASDHEYRGEETLPAMARILAKHHGFDCTVLFGLNDKGEIQAGKSNIPGLEALESADGMVIFTRFQSLPDDQMKHIDAYLNRGGPVMGLRTSTHGFKYGERESAYSKYDFKSNTEGYERGFGHQVLGQSWVGHYGRNHTQSTRITIIPNKARHPILIGVKDIHVQCGAYNARAADDWNILTMAQPLMTMAFDSEPDASKPPKASEWTREYTAANGAKGRVFTSLYGASEDILNEGYRRMLVNATYWMLGLEEQIKADSPIDFVGKYQPNTFRFGGHARGVKPADYNGFKSPIPANNITAEPEKKKPAAVKPSAKLLPVKAKPKKASAPTPQLWALATNNVPAGHKDPARFAFQAGDVIAMIGNGLGERMQYAGWMETLVQSHEKDKKLRFRNLSISGDRVDQFPRNSGFMPVDAYLQHLKANVVLAFFGYNESFDNSPGDYTRKLNEMVKNIRATKPADAFPRIVLFSPIAHEDLGTRDVPNGKANNRRLKAITAATKAAAEASGVTFVDLFTPSRAAYEANDEPLTINGIHLNELGNRLMGEVIAEALTGSKVTAAESMAKVRESVLDKNTQWFDRFRAVDGNDVWGSRSKLRFVGKQTNGDVLRHELVMMDVMTANRDQKIWARANGGDHDVLDENVPKPIEVISNVGGKGKMSSLAKEGSLKYLTSEESIGKMDVPKDFQINVFADEKQFPQLVNPVQMQVDTRGRLWVAAWSNYPKQAPIRDVDDALLIFEDIDKDGRADKVTKFANINNPLGFEFWGGGVIVSSQPNLVFLKDTDGDDIADEREILLHGVGSADTHHACNNLIYGPDGGIYWQSGIFLRNNFEHPWGPSLSTGASAMYRFDPRRYTISLHGSNGPNPHGISFDRWGYHFATDGTGGRAYQVRPNGTRWKMHYLLKKEVRPVSASEILSSAHFPDEMQQNFLICNTIGFLGIKQYKLNLEGGSQQEAIIGKGKDAKTVVNTTKFGEVWGEPNGVELTVMMGDTEVKSTGLLLSGDNNFRPTDCIVGEDGALYVSDWANVIIGHMQHNIRDPNRDHQHGRIIRITHKSRPLQKPVKIDGQPIAALLENLKHPVDGVRHRTRIELSERDSKEVIGATKEWMKDFDPAKEDEAHHLLEALWLHQQHNTRNGKLLTKLMQSPVQHASLAATTVQHHWYNADPARGGGGVIVEAEEAATQKSGILSDTPELTTIRIGTIRERMRYDVTKLTVKPGKKVKLSFANPDYMPHNIMLVNPGKADEVGLKAIALGASGFSVNYVPESPEIIWASKLVDHGQEEVIEFTAPTEEGAYPYICSFPGHHMLMRGTLYVTNNLEDFLVRNPEQVTKMTEWKLADLEKDLKRVGQHRNFERGQQLFTKLACAQCHKLDNKSVALSRSLTVGPNLDEVVKKHKHDAKAILMEILEPSRKIEEKFRTVLLGLEDGTTLNGNIVSENPTTLTILTGPPQFKETKVAKSAIEARRSSPVSIMPAALLNTLDKEQILDLLAYVIAGGNAQDGAFKHHH